METREHTPSVERRIVAAAGLKIERREAGAPPRIVGHAAVFDAWTTHYDSQYSSWREVVRPGAFKNALSEKQDVRALFNHDANFVLGRSTAGTLRMSEDARGLLTDTDPSDTQLIRDLVLSPIERGDVSGMSFAFSVRRGASRTVTDAGGKRVEETSGERITSYERDGKFFEERELLDLDLYDVSPVTYPQYEQTDVALRSRGEQRDAEIKAKLEGRDVPPPAPAPVITYPTPEQLAAIRRLLLIQLFS